MSEKVYFCILFLCGLLCQEIPGVFSKDVAKSSDHLGRRKRVINLEPGADVPLWPEGAPFIVNIREYPNNLTFCVGTILSKHTVITVASCALHRRESSIKITSASIYSYRGGVFHDVLTINIRIGNHPNRDTDGVALLTVEPGFDYNRKTLDIPLHEGPLLPGMHATIFGWGCNPAKPRGTNFKYRLRSITVPIMNHRDCVNSYRNHVEISDNDICTYDENKRCGHTDAGAPLVVDNQLAGLHLWRAPLPNRVGPDVFVVVQSLEYGPWIKSNIIHSLVRIRGRQ